MIIALFAKGDSTQMCIQSHINEHYGETLKFTISTLNESITKELIKDEIISLKKKLDKWIEDKY